MGTSKSVCGGAKSSFGGDYVNLEVNSDVIYMLMPGETLQRIRYIKVYGNTPGCLMATYTWNGAADLDIFQ